MTNEERAQPTPAGAVERPLLLFFYSRTGGASRRADGFLSQVLQRRRNHATFELLRIDADARPDLKTHFRVTELPALFVIEKKKVIARAVRPRGCIELTRLLEPWLH